MSSSITFLSHASCVIDNNKTNLLFDPWLIGSCYWRSWWNYPPVQKEAYENIVPDAIYITHFHWDHWHGPSLKKLFSKNTLIITHDEPNKRSFNDLRQIGFRNIKLLKHGETFSINDISITPYQFGLFLNDSAVVVETPDFKVFNANDCKIAGSALRQVLDKHGTFDFALRSHSSANDRVCYSIKNDETFKNDDSVHYARSFKLFMDAVNPNYAIPFASNHVHLHKDVYSTNAVVNDPFKLKETLEELGGLKANFKIMLSGDSWDSNCGFSISKENVKYFDDKTKMLEQYLHEKTNILNKYYKLEDRTKISNKIIAEFVRQMDSIPMFFRKKFKSLKYLLNLFSDNQQLYFVVEPYKSSVERIDSLDKNLSTVKIPIKVFRDSVLLNMFHHSSISKRNSYVLNNKEDFNMYSAFQQQLELVELGVYPLRVVYIKDLFFSYCRRWRELIVYFKAYFLLRKGIPVYDAEEEILAET